jgi:hypothetical protein
LLNDETDIAAAVAEVADRANRLHWTFDLTTVDGLVAQAHALADSSDGRNVLLLVDLSRLG